VCRHTVCGALAKLRQVRSPCQPSARLSARVLPICRDAVGYQRSRPSARDDAEAMNALVALRKFGRRRRCTMSAEPARLGSTRRLAHSFQSSPDPRSILALRVRRYPGSAPAGRRESGPERKLAALLARPHRFGAVGHLRHRASAGRRAGHGAQPYAVRAHAPRPEITALRQLFGEIDEPTVARRRFAERTARTTWLYTIGASTAVGRIVFARIR
jgi:hypothetical protein